MAKSIKTSGKAQAYEVGELILIPENFEENKALILNNVAAYVWKKFENPRGITAKTLVKSVLEDFEIDQEHAMKDLKVFLEILDYMNLLDSDGLSFANIPKFEVIASESKQSYRTPKIYVYNLDNDDEVAFGPHIKGRTYVHRAITKSWHGGCC